jgi:aminoglycoside phosphotransferase (APT) family kinase protein
VDNTAEAAAQERPPLIVREPLQEFLDHHDLGEGDVEAEPIGDGHSNVTYLIVRGDDRFVLRRPPRPPVPPSANDVLRESRLLTALQPTDVPTADVLAVCDDESVIGAPFYVMPFLEGHVITTEMPPELDNPEQRRRTAFELVDALAQVHAADWQAIGLDSFAKPTGYLERQVKRFTGLCSARRASCRSCRRSATGSRSTCLTPLRRRSSTATTASATRCSRPRHRRG